MRLRDKLITSREVTRKGERSRAKPGNNEITREKTKALEEKREMARYIDKS